MEARADTPTGERSGRDDATPVDGRGERAPGLGFRHLLVPLDGSSLAHCVLPFVAAVAGTFRARVTLLRVLEGYHQAALDRHVDPLECEIRRAAACNELNALASELQRVSVPSAAEVVWGNAAEQIIQCAEKDRADLIVLASHGEGGVSPWMLGGTAQKVMMRSPTSLLVVPAYAGSKARIGALRLAKILVPLDCSCRAECVLPLAIALARSHDAELILAHVVAEPELPRHLSPAPSDVRLAAQLTQLNRNEAERYLVDLQARIAADGGRARVRLLVSPHCIRTLRKLADEEHVDLVLLAAHGQSGDPEVRYGVVAARLMQSGSRPMIIVQDLAGALHVVTPAEDAVHEHAGH
jgi:nucleotide-binding universal stress UspA family protein